MGSEQQQDDVEDPDSSQRELHVQRKLSDDDPSKSVLSELPKCKWPCSLRMTLVLRSTRLTCNDLQLSTSTVRYEIMDNPPWHEGLILGFQVST